jgi:hypothetical protein
MSPPQQPKYPKLPAHLRGQLDAITPSIEPIAQLAYYPCMVTKTDGTLQDRVYFVSEIPWITLWGLYPNRDPGKQEVLISDVASVAESPSRLPAEFATQLYRAGESGMGYMIFTVVFKRIIPFLHQRRVYATGNAVDFIDYPWGKGPKDVVEVLPHAGRRSRFKHGPNYYWCLYSE